MTDTPSSIDAVSADNPLLDFSDLPRFADFSPSQVKPALDYLLDQARQVMQASCDASQPVDWAHVVTPLDECIDRLSRAWGMVGHLNSVADSDEIRAVYNNNLPRMTQFFTELGQSTALFERYKALQASEQFAALSHTRQHILNQINRDFVLGGADLVSPQRERFAEIQEKTAALSQKFSENVLDATNAFELIEADDTRLTGLPDDAINAARQDAQQAGKEGYRFTLQFPSYFPILQYADNRDLRETIYRANVTRASEMATVPSDTKAREAIDNSGIIKELLALRAEEARLLGYQSFAEVSLVSKMADSPEQVIEFLRDLAKRARPFALKDLQELRDFAAKELSLPELQPFDYTYAAEKLRQSRYDFSDNLVKQYFQLPRVLAGLFAQVERMFGVEIAPDQSTTWHDTVQFFQIKRDGQRIGQFYLDLFARTSKRPGAWMNDARNRMRIGDDLQLPVAYLVCNFQAPIDDNPALLTHDDVTTLFHEFGHGLHHMLTQVEESHASGIAGVEWDAVELPSQFMENFCWEWPIVESMSAHVDSGESLPRELFSKMLAAKNFQAGMQTLRQIEFSLFDMLLHGDYDPNGQQTVQQLLDEVRAEVSVVPGAPYSRFQNSFSHIFSGGYSAGYYSYKWAEVLSADAYGAFEEAMASTDPEKNTLKTGQIFLEEILAVGGSRPAIDSFKAFRGREPSITALLRHNGMVENSLSEPSSA